MYKIARDVIRDQREVPRDSHTFLLPVVLPTAARVILHKQTLGQVIPLPNALHGFQ